MCQNWIAFQQLLDFWGKKVNREFSYHDEMQKTKTKQKRVETLWKKEKVLPEEVKFLPGETASPTFLLCI